MTTVDFNEIKSIKKNRIELSKAENEKNRKYPYNIIPFSAKSKEKFRKQLVKKVELFNSAVSTNTTAPFWLKNIVQHGR